MQHLTPAPNIDRNYALSSLMELLPIPGPSGDECRVIDYLRQACLRAGVPAQCIVTDNAHQRSPLGGNVGNLIINLPSSRPAPRRLLIAHTDTVPGCVGSRPILDGNKIISANPTCGLGADDRCGVGVLLAVVHELFARDIPHPPLTLLFSVQEEVGMLGVRHCDVEMLRAPSLSFNFDGGRAFKLTIGSIGADRIEINVHGLRAHAGLCPENGVNAIVAAGKAIAALQSMNLVGRVSYFGKTATINLGTIFGGTAVNVVPDSVSMRAEVRAHDLVLRATLVEHIKLAFERSVEAVSNVYGRTATLEFASRTDYEAFELPRDEPCVTEAVHAVGSVGLEPLEAVVDGGTDANWMFIHGIPTVSLGAGQIKAHTLEESVDINEYLNACQIALRLATGNTEQHVNEGETRCLMTY